MSDSLSVPWTWSNSKPTRLYLSVSSCASVPNDKSRRRFCDARSSVTSGPTSGRSYASSPRWRKSAMTLSTRSVTNQSSSYGAPTVFCGRCPNSPGALCDLHQRGGGQGCRVALPVPRLALRSLRDPLEIENWGTSLSQKKKKWIPQVRLSRPGPASCSSASPPSQSPSPSSGAPSDISLPGT